MNKVKFVLDQKGVRDSILKSDTVASMTMQTASEIAGACGDGYVAETRSYPERTGAAVRTDSIEAYFDNLKNNTLEKTMRGSK